MIEIEVWDCIILKHPQGALRLRFFVRLLMLLPWGARTSKMELGSVLLVDRANLPCLAVHACRRGVHGSVPLVIHAMYTYIYI